MRPVLILGNNNDDISEYCGIKPASETTIIFSASRTPENKMLLERNKLSSFIMPTGITFSEWRKSFHGEPRRLGSGAFGCAFLHNVDGHKFVLKEIFGTDVEKNIREIQHLALFVNNPYVVQLLAAEVYAEITYILYPYIPGHTLTDFLKTHPAPNLIKEVYNHLITGLISIHDLGYVHRDIKPDNVWIPTDSHVLPFYLDLGSMVRTGSENDFAGTRRYSPYSKWNTIPKEPQKEWLNYYALGKLMDETHVLGSNVIARRFMNRNSSNMTRNIARGLRIAGAARRRRNKTVRKIKSHRT